MKVLVSLCLHFIGMSSAVILTSVLWNIFLTPFGLPMIGSAVNLVRTFTLFWDVAVALTHTTGSDKAFEQEEVLEQVMFKAPVRQLLTSAGLFAAALIARRIGS